MRLWHYGKMRHAADERGVKGCRWKGKHSLFEFLEIGVGLRQSLVTYIRP